MSEAYESLFLRVDPALKEALMAQVDGANKSRPPGDPPVTLNSWVQRLLYESLGEPVGVLLVDHAKQERPRRRKAGKK